MTNRMSKQATRPGRLRRTALSLAAVGLLTGTAACSDSAGPEDGEVTTQDLQDLEERVGELDNRVGTLENDGMAPEDIDDMDFADPALLGEKVTVSAAVSELVTDNGTNAAFRIAGDEGEPIAVLSVDPPEDLEVEDVVQVTGTVTQIDPDTFESDFGVAAEDVFDDPDAFFEEAQDQVGIRAEELEVLDDEALG